MIVNLLKENMASDTSFGPAYNVMSNLNFKLS